MILWESTTLQRSGLLGIPQANERSLDASLPADQGGARHKEIVYHPETQTRWVPRFIEGIELPPEMKTDYRLPDWWFAGNFDRAIVVMAECPINLLITDPQGRRVGYDPASGQVLHEISNALYIGPSQEPQLIVITNPVSGTYQVTTSGFDTGTYSVLVDQLDATGLHPSAFGLLGTLDSPRSVFDEGFLLYMAGMVISIVGLTIRYANTEKRSWTNRILGGIVLLFLVCGGVVLLLH